MRHRLLTILSAALIAVPGTAFGQAMVGYGHGVARAGATAGAAAGAGAAGIFSKMKGTLDEGAEGEGGNTGPRFDSEEMKARAAERAAQKQEDEHDRAEMAGKPEYTEKKMQGGIAVAGHASKARIAVGNAPEVTASMTLPMDPGAEVVTLGYSDVAAGPAASATPAPAAAAMPAPAAAAPQPVAAQPARQYAPAAAPASAPAAEPQRSTAAVPVDSPAPPAPSRGAAAAPAPSRSAATPDRAERLGVDMVTDGGAQPSSGGGSHTAITTPRPVGEAPRRGTPAVAPASPILSALPQMADFPMGGTVEDVIALVGKPYMQMTGTYGNGYNERYLFRTADGQIFAIYAIDGLVAGIQLRQQGSWQPVLAL